MGISAIAICIAFGVTYFTLGIHPYRFIIFIFYALLFPSFNFVLVYFASRPMLFKGSSSDRNPASKHSSKHDSKSLPTDQVLVVASMPDTYLSVHGSTNN